MVVKLETIEQAENLVSCLKKIQKYPKYFVRFDDNITKNLLVCYHLGT